MRKPFIFILSVIVMCVSCSSCNKSDLLYERVSDTDNDVTFIVNGKDISSENFVSINYEEQYAELPLIAITEALGGEVEWVSNKKVFILFNGTNYILNPTKKTLKQKRDSFNMIALPPGAQHGACYQIGDEEFIIDSDCLRYFLRLLGAKITIHYETASVIIDSF